MLNSEGLLCEISKEQYDKLVVEYAQPVEEEVLPYSQSGLSNPTSKKGWKEVKIPAGGGADDAPWEESKENLPAFESATETTSAEGPTIVPDDYDVLESYAGVEIVSDELPEMAAFPDNDSYQPAAAAETTAPPADVNVQRIAAEIVFRRLFQHIYSKCGWDGAGKFTNAGAVLEAVPIDDITEAKSLFTKMDTFSPEGAYQSAVEITSHITGLVSKEQLPYYRVYLNIGGQIVKRTFIPQNPDKTKNGQITTWANKVRQGSRIAMLLGNNGPTMHIETEPGQMLGQEKFEIWKQS
jgi:hypothetical protein